MKIKSIMQLTAVTVVVEKPRFSSKRTTHLKFLEEFAITEDSLNNDEAIIYCF